MTKKESADKEKPSLTLDVTGLNLGSYCPTRHERLEKGTPLDVRRALGQLAFNLDPERGLAWEKWVSKDEREWLSKALYRISSGEDANSALRLKSRRKSYKSIDEIAEIRYMLDDLRKQGASKSTALALVASCRLGWDKNRKKKPKAGSPTPEQCNAEIERLKKILGKKKD